MKPNLSFDLKEESMITDENRLLGLIARKFKADYDSLNFNEDIFFKLGINSLQALDLLSEVESEFDITIQDSELRGIKTFQHLLDIIRR